MPIASIVAIICITALAIVALANDVDGALLASTFVIIAGLGGFIAGKKVKPK